MLLTGQESGVWQQVWPSVLVVPWKTLSPIELVLPAAAFPWFPTGHAV